MNLSLPTCRNAVSAMAAFSLAAILAVSLGAGPAAHAHGDEPHGDAPHPVAGGAPAVPRFEAATEAFEIVGRLEGGALTLFINRFETSEPVSDGTVELESGDLKAVAAYQPAQGAFVVNDAKLVEALSRPGKHPLVMTLMAGKDSDLLEATLVVQAAAATASAAATPLRLPALAGGGAAALLALGLGVWAVRRRQKNKLKGGLA